MNRAKLLIIAGAAMLALTTTVSAGPINAAPGALVTPPLPTETVYYRHYYHHGYRHYGYRHYGYGYPHYGYRHYGYGHPSGRHYPRHWQ